MQKNSDSKLSIWVVPAAIICCGLPLLLLAGSGALIALITGFLVKNILLIILALLLAGIAAWLLLKRKRS